MMWAAAIRKGFSELGCARRTERNEPAKTPPLRLGAVSSRPPLATFP